MEDFLFSFSSSLKIRLIRYYTINYRIICINTPATGTLEELSADVYQCSKEREIATSGSEPSHSCSPLVIAIIFVDSAD